MYMKMQKIIISPVVLHGCETWSAAPRECLRIRCWGDCLDQGRTSDMRIEKVT